MFISKLDFFEKSEFNQNNIWPLKYFFILFRNKNKCASLLFLFFKSETLCLKLSCWRKEIKYHKVSYAFQWYMHKHFLTTFQEKSDTLLDFKCKRNCLSFSPSLCLVQLWSMSDHSGRMHRSKASQLKPLNFIKLSHHHSSCAHSHHWF